MWSSFLVHTANLTDIAISDALSCMVACPCTPHEWARASPCVGMLSRRVRHTRIGGCLNFLSTNPCHVTTELTQIPSRIVCPPPCFASGLWCSHHAYGLWALVFTSCVCRRLQRRPPGVNGRHVAVAIDNNRMGGVASGRRCPRATGRTRGCHAQSQDNGE
jgi:hypothetical protein